MSFKTNLLFITTLAAGTATIASGCCSTSAAFNRAITFQSDQVYAIQNDQRLLADVYIPAGSDAKPGLLLLHSGSWARGSKERMSEVAEAFAARGYVVVNANYRLAPTHRFPAQLRDCESAIRWMRSHASELNLDPGRIGVIGHSAGGHLALLLATAATDARPNAVATAGAPADLLAMPNVRSIREFVGSDPESDPEAFRLASPVHHVDGDDIPVLLVHGTHDWIVPVSQSQEMERALREAGVPVELRELDAGHVSTTTGINEEQVGLMAEFFGRVI